MDTENVVVTKQDRKYKTLVTDIGNKKMTNAILNGKKVNVVMAAVGDGGGSYYLPTADMTALVHEVWRGAIASKEINSKSSNMVDVKFVLPGTVGGFTAREASLIDDEGDMIAVCNLPDTEKAAIEDGIAAALTILMHIVMTNSDALTFTLDPTTDTASAVCVAFTIPHEAWQSTTGAEDDESGGTYPCRADVVCDEATAMHTPIATLDKACLAAAKACELCPTVETARGVLRFWAMKVPDGELTGSVLLVGQGGGGKSGDGSYTLPTATPFRLGGVKVGDGLTVDNEGKLSVDAANTEETTGALNEVFGAEDGPGHGNGVQRLHQQLQGIQLLLRVLHRHGPALHEGGLVGSGQLAGDQLRLGHGGQAHGRLLRQDVPLAAGAGAMKIHSVTGFVRHMVHGHTIGGTVTVGHGQGGIGGVTQHLPGKGGVTFLVFSAHRMHGLSSLSLFRPAGRSIRFHHIMGRPSSFSNRGSIPSSTWPAFWHIS